MQRKLISALVGAICAAGFASVQAQSTPYYNPTNAASPTGLTIGYDLNKSIGCPGKSLMDASCNNVPAEAKAKAKPAPAPAPAPAAAPAVVMAGKTLSSVMYLPTGVRATSALMIERTAPAEVVAGQPFDYSIKATNLTANPLSAVMVQDMCSSNFRLLSSSPEAERVSPTLLRWKLGDLSANESRVIDVKGEVVDANTAQNCMSGSYDQASCMLFNVVQPKLSLKASAPAEVLRCDAIPLTYSIANNGTGVARNASISQTLPEGVSIKDGFGTMAVGDLSAGAAKDTKLAVMAAKTGIYEFRPAAVADPGMKAEAVATTRVTEPTLRLDKRASSTLIVGREVAYEITVTNSGDAVARNLVMEESLPAGVKLVSASNGGRVDAGRVVWSLPDLAPKQSQTVKLTVQPQSIGSLDTSTRAAAYCAADASIQAKSAVVGIPAVLLEVVDVVDPVEIGKETTYVITATNQGTATDINVRIIAELESSMQLVAAEGATSATGTGARIEFAPLAKLEPGTKAVWKVTAKALAPSDHRFTVIMNSDLRQRPVQETEATTLYK